MPWVLSIVIIAITIICFAIAARTDFDVIFGLFCTVGIVCGIIAIISTTNAIFWTDCMINLEARQANVNAKGAVYTKLLNDYEQTLMTNDVTASESYLNLYEKILNYNNQVRRANQWKDTWGVSGILYDPSYMQAELIPIGIE